MTAKELDKVIGHKVTVSAYGSQESGVYIFTSRNGRIAYTSCGAAFEYADLEIVRDLTKWGELTR